MKNKSTHEQETRDSRRRFTKTIAAALVAAPLVALKTNDAQTPPAATPSPSPSPTPTPNPKTVALVDAYANVARVRFGEGLNDEEFGRVRRGLENNVANADRLRAAKLNNSDEPDFVFSA